MLPLFNISDRQMQMLQTQWKAQIDPVLVKPQNLSLILPNVQLQVGTNVINHRLGSKLQGWNITRQRGPANIYDNQDSNQSPELTLVLVSDAIVNINLEVF